MEMRECKDCKKEFELNEENFHLQNKTEGIKRGFRRICRSCNNEQRRYNYSLKKVLKKKEEEDAWKKDLLDKRFICIHCGKEKTFHEMKSSAFHKGVYSTCRKCHYQKKKDVYMPNVQLKHYEQAVNLKKENN